MPQLLLCNGCEDLHEAKTAEVSAHGCVTRSHHLLLHFLHDFLSTEVHTTEMLSWMQGLALEMQYQWVHCVWVPPLAEVSEHNALRTCLARGAEGTLQCTMGGYSDLRTIWSRSQRTCLEPLLVSII